MTEQEILTEQQRYPIGHFTYHEQMDEQERNKMIETIESFPERLKKLCNFLSEEQLNASYRPGGWTIRQLIHHLADAHMNAYLRFKLALTEDRPTIKPYNEKAWAEMIDSKDVPVAVSLQILSGIHKRWVCILKAMDEETFHRTFFHPENMNMHELLEILAMYAWHCNHHYEHIRIAKQNAPAAEPKRSKSRAPKKEPKAAAARKKGAKAKS